MAATTLIRDWEADHRLKRKKQANAPSRETIQRIVPACFDVEAWPAAMPKAPLNDQTAVAVANGQTFLTHQARPFGNLPRLAVPTH